ncbi:MAG: WecB/TagA/CpsF family glycosyltransferase [Phycisphaerae bacterium]|nr:WecB/TagA/CpsF family glycosyltransferase [Phycisphaerae bacterium]MDW8261935.1 WecB/TagA/CpsF family glycosyltransferase [Phycisphaerales bacterium]
MPTYSVDAVIDRNLEPSPAVRSEPGALRPPSAGDALLAPPPALPTIDLAGVELHAVTQSQVVEYILSELDSNRGGMLVTPNLDHLYRCVKDLSFAALVSEADLIVADGMPLVWAARIQGTPLPARVAGSDLIWSLSEAAARRGRSIYLLGGAPGTAEAAAKVLCERYQNLRVVGTYCPPMGFEHNEREVAAIINDLATAQPDIVYVALGSPKQERLICRIRNCLPAAWWLGVGISFSFVCGDVRRAPLWMQKAGLEWIHRLWQEPRRLFKRYIIQGLPFACRLMLISAWRRIAGIPPRTSSRRQVRRAAPREVPTASGGEQPSAPELLRSGEPLTAGRLDGHASGNSLKRLRAVILLGGNVRQTPLQAAVRRSVLDLPLEQDTTLLNHWLGQAAELARYAGLEKLPVRVLVNTQSFEPVSGAARYAGSYTVERDASEYRGTGGVLRDLAQSYHEDDWILVASASQVLLDSLHAIASTLDRKRGDVSLISHRDGTPSGVMLVRVATLSLIPPIGFCDMKEQGLSEIAKRYEVKVKHSRWPTGLPVRTLADYIGALHAHHRRKSGRAMRADPLEEDWQPNFAIVEAGATVAPGAYLHDAVVLRGAMVEAGASVVRSVVCDGAVVRQKQNVIDRFVTA